MYLLYSTHDYKYKFMSKTKSFYKESLGLSRCVAVASIYTNTIRHYSLSAENNFWHYSLTVPYSHTVI